MNEVRSDLLGQNINIRDICVVISSSDNTRDVFMQTSPSFERFWPDCSYPIYVGMNTPVSDKVSERFTFVYADVSNWRVELRQQLAQIQERYLILFLDDFVLLEEVDTKALSSIIQYGMKHKIPYLRLVPVSRAWIPRKIYQIFHAISHCQVERIPLTQPYYSSLQVALWRKDHLMSCLTYEGSIWDFEHQRIPGINHYAVVKPLIRYVHVVEKGKWQPYARTIINRVSGRFHPGKRQELGLASYLRWYWAKFRFAMIGYIGVRSRIIIRQIVSHLLPPLKK